MFIDSHAHLDFNEISSNFSKVIKNSNKNKITSILSICTKIKSFKKLYNLIKNYKSIWCSIGEHPCNISKNNIPLKNDILSYTLEKKIIAIGETGLDFFHSTKNIDYQYESLQSHIDASVESNLPLIIHLRNSENELIKYLSSENKKYKLKVVMHCFTGSKKLLFECLDNDFYISLSGIITFKSSLDLQNLVKSIPLDKLLIETDSPFLSPVPFRGKSNQPSNVYYIAKFISLILNTNINTIGFHTSNNFYKLFSKAIRYDEINYEN